MNISVAELKFLFPHHTLTLPDTTCPRGVSKDTRTLQQEEIYVAIRGDHFDGHDFVAKSFAQGALLALVAEGFPQRENLIYCEDTVIGLTQLARTYRLKFTQPLIAITGSNGKTTTKEFLAHVLSLSGRVIATRGNLNNHIGVPLTLLNFSSDASAFIVEMGMNHRGEIRSLTQLAKPDIGLITSIGKAHLEGVGGTLADVACAKGELFAELTESQTAVVNLDDELIAALPTRAQRLTYGFSASAEIRAENPLIDGAHTKFTLVERGTKGDTRHVVRLSLVGTHHVRNALAVYAIARKLGRNAQQIIHGIESFNIDMNRGRVLQKRGLTVVDDSYNANPDSMLAAFESFQLQFPEHRRIAALGGMRELGKSSAALHHWVGEQARKCGLSALFVLGDDAEHYLQGFGVVPEQLPSFLFKDHDLLARALTAVVSDRENTAVLVKGSRGYTMEIVIDKI